MMHFVETSIFTKQVTTLLTDGEYRDLQEALIGEPKGGPLIQRTGGARKVRWGYSGSGKRGGVRIIYYWHEQSETFFMLYVFAKNQQANLTQAQKKQLRALIGGLS